MSKDETAKSPFEALLADLGTMAKAMPAGGDDKKIDDAANGAGEGDDKGADDTGGESDDKGGEEAVVKSFTLKLEDGTEVPAIDGAGLIKALTDRVERNEGDMVKALGDAVALIKGQGEIVKSLQDEVKKLAGEGRGRKAVVTIAERKPADDMRKSDADSVTADQFMAKALVAQAQGLITGADVARAESYLNRGLKPPAEIVARVYPDAK